MAILGCRARASDQDLTASGPTGRSAHLCRCARQACDHCRRRSGSFGWGRVARFVNFLTSCPILRREARTFLTSIDCRGRECASANAGNNGSDALTPPWGWPTAMPKSPDFEGENATAVRGAAVIGRRHFSDRTRQGAPAQGVAYRSRGLLSSSARHSRRSLAACWDRRQASAWASVDVRSLGTGVNGLCTQISRPLS